MAAVSNVSTMPVRAKISCVRLIPADGPASIRGEAVDVSMGADYVLMTNIITATPIMAALLAGFLPK